MKHYLISVRLTSPPKTHFHSYLMCEDDKFVEQGCSKMSSLCEENGVEIFPAFMVTALDADGKAPRSPQAQPSQRFALRSIRSASSMPSVGYFSRKALRMRAFKVTS